MRRLIEHCSELIGRMAAGTDGPVAIAVSGGSDSLALLVIADAWSRQTGRPLRVLTVDHGLRPEAGREALEVQGIARAMGHDAEILTWQPDKSSQEAARQARHSLLAGACRKAGASLLLLGHTMDDVQETLLMRLSRPTTLMGAFGPLPVSVSPVWPDGRGLLLGRPLLGQRREMLRDVLRTRGMRWVDDPSNEALKYERVRIRRLAAHLDQARLDRITKDAMRLRALEDAQLARALLDCAHMDAAGLVSLALMQLPQNERLAGRLLSMLIQAAAGTDDAPAAGQIVSLMADIASAGPASRLTLGGAWLQRQADTLLIGRDPGEARSGWQDGVWDGRYARQAGGDTPQTTPFLVRHSVPHGDGWREIISERLAHWAQALRLGAEMAAREVQARYQTPRLSPAQT